MSFCILQDAKGQKAGSGQDQDETKVPLCLAIDPQNKILGVGFSEPLRIKVKGKFDITYAIKSVAVSPTNKCLQQKLNTYYTSGFWLHAEKHGKRYDTIPVNFRITGDLMFGKDTNDYTPKWLKKNGKPILSIKIGFEGGADVFGSFPSGGSNGPVGVLKQLFQESSGGNKFSIGMKLSVMPTIKAKLFHKEMELPGKKLLDFIDEA